ncbi:MAG: GMC family oxidoreductase N-terminal domain-containing protein, partial [Actinomycetota bacterium]|nr:GMC family oxidoreductase N-terminal domain-containing protein [Actinomycetota bacterium]
MNWYNRTGWPLGAAHERILRAFAEAMAPATSGLPGATGPDAVGAQAADRVDVIPALAEYMTFMPPGKVRLLRVAIAAFDRLPLPRRFSRADLASRRDFLERLDRSPRIAHRELLMLLRLLCGIAYCNDSRVQLAVGSESRCAVAAGDGVPTAAPNLGDLTPRGGGEECDVAIVGSGAGGAAAAAILAEAGVDVLVLEAGPHLNCHTYPDEPLAALGALYRDGGLTLARGLPSIPTPVGRAVGGTTVVNSGTCFRAPDRILERWRSEHGVAWAEELADEYSEAEEMLDVRPVDPDRMGRNGQILRDGAEARGVSHHPLSRNAGGCINCSSCPYGCRLDQKRAMHVSYLPRAVAAGARVRAGVEARTVTFDDKRATGLDCVAGVADPRAREDTGRSKPRHARLTATAGEPKPYRVVAKRAVLVAGGAFGTPELLLRSGVESRSGQIGANLRIHPACWVGARFDEEVRGWDGVMQSYAVDEWRDRGIMLEATFTPLAFGGHWLPGVGAEHQERLAAYDHIASTGVQIADRSKGRIRLTRSGSPRISYRLERADVDRLTFGIARTAELFFAAGAREVYPQIAGMPTLERSRIDGLEANPPSPGRLRLEAFHPMGTARMDDHPARGVVGSDGSV